MNLVQRLARLEQKAGAKISPVPTNLPYDQWVGQNLNIRTKQGTLALLSYNPIQDKLNAIYDGLKNNHGQAHIIVSKARQHGVSTWWQSRIFERCARNANVQALVLAHDREGSDWLFGMSRLYYDTLPEGEKPGTDYSSKKEIVFSPPLRSSISVQVAHEYAGSAKTVQLLHISELSKWADPKTTMLSLMQAAAYADVVIESTANGQQGQGEYFYKMWEDAKAGKSDYVPVFFAWFDNPTYSIHQNDSRYMALMTEPLNDEEEALKQKHQLTLEQMAWRRWAIRNLCGTDVEAFRQEYPANDEEAFLRIEGVRVFDIGRCRVGLTKASDPVAVGRLKWAVPPRLDATGYALNRNFLKVAWQEDSNGPLSVWAFPPEKGEDFSANRFYGAADVALGVEGGDHSSAVILDRRSRQIVATWHQRIDPTIWGESLAMLGIWYKATMAPEVNSMGNTALSRLMGLYDGVWCSRRHSPGVPWLDTEAGKWGVYTSANKEYMIQFLIDAIRDGLWTDPDEAFWREALNVVRNERGLADTKGKDRVAARFILATIDRLGPVAEYPRLPMDQRPSDYKLNRGNRSRKYGLSRYKGDWRLA